MHRTAILATIFATACDASDVERTEPRSGPACGLQQVGSPVHQLARELRYCDDGPAISDYDCARALANLIGAADDQMWDAVSIHELGCYSGGIDPHCGDLLDLADDAQGQGPVGCAFPADDFWSCFDLADPPGVLPEITVAALCGALVMP